MASRAKKKFYVYWIVVGLAFAATTTMLFTYTPTLIDAQGDPHPYQKIFYIHLPAAINAFLACLIAFLGGIGFLWQRKMVWDDLSAAAAKVAAIMCTVVLLSGMFWGKKEWGVWWDWSPRMTFTLLLWLLYVVYLIIRPSIESKQRRATVCAVYAVAAFLDVPLVWLSTRLIPDSTHPKLEGISFERTVTLLAWFVPVTLLTVGLIKADFIRKRASRRLEEAAPPPETPWTVDTIADVDSDSQDKADA